MSAYLHYLKCALSNKQIIKYRKCFTKIPPSVPDHELNTEPTKEIVLVPDHHRESSPVLDEFLIRYLNV